MNQMPVDEAVLCLAEALGVIHGKKALQKLIYFLQEAEHLPLGLTFEMHHYGPYSQELEWITRDLGATRQLEITPSDGTFLIRSRNVDRQPLQPHFQRVIDLLGSRKPWELELYASLHYLAELKPYSGTSSDKDSLKERLLAWKGTKFPMSQIDASIANLEDMGYLAKA